MSPLYPKAVTKDYFRPSPPLNVLVSNISAAVDPIFFLTVSPESLPLSPFLPEGGDIQSQYVYTVCVCVCVCIYIYIYIYFFFPAAGDGGQCPKCQSNRLQYAIVRIL
jgi:hypothetical protein